MSESEATAEAKKEIYSFERLIVELECIRSGLEGTVWTHLKALSSIPGHGTAENIHGKPRDKLDRPVTPPMIRVYNLVADIKEMVNQVDIALNNLGHELVPNWYEEQDKTIPPQ